MKKSFIAALLVVPIAGCMVGEGDPEVLDPMTFAEFRAETYREPWEGGVYVVNGDTPILDDKALEEFWNALQHPGELIVNTQGGVDTKWTDTQKRNLTYCVSDTFGSRKATVVEALRQATDLGWETRGNVNFVYVPAQDASCTASNSNVVFDVRPVNAGGQYLARAFFPNNARSSRNVLIDSTAFSAGGWPLANILAHELGHALGFRHEHTRPEAGTCFEDNNWRPLTPYDSASVMHYPQCRGSSNNLAFSSRDRDGIQALYGAPDGSPPPPPPTGVDRTQSWSGVVSANQGANLTPVLSVVAGSTLTVTMTGSGDPDLYVRFGAAPTRSTYACRPYIDGAGEQCSLTVPAGQTQAYVMVYGYQTYAQSSYSITANYRSPN